MHILEGEGLGTRIKMSLYSWGAYFQWVPIILILGHPKKKKTKQNKTEKHYTLSGMEKKLHLLR